MFTLSENLFLRVETVKKNGILHVNRFFLLNVMEVENNNNNNKKKKTFINLFGLYGARPEQQQQKNRKPKEEEEEENELDDLCPHDLLSLSVRITYLLPRSSGACDMCYCFFPEEMLIVLLSQLHAIRAKNQEKK
jgi:hypothetical protein